jgi:hypothetical protein
LDNRPCEIFATLGEYFCPITLLGDFPVRMSQLEHVRGACGMGVETILLIVILAFAAGFVLDRLVIRQGRFDAAKPKKEQ